MAHGRVRAEVELLREGTSFVVLGRRPRPTGSYITEPRTHRITLGDSVCANQADARLTSVRTASRSIAPGSRRTGRAGPGPQGQLLSCRSDGGEDQRCALRCGVPTSAALLRRRAQHFSARQAQREDEGFFGARGVERPKPSLTDRVSEAARKELWLQAARGAFAASGAAERARRWQESRTHFEPRRCRSCTRP